MPWFITAISKKDSKQIDYRCFGFYNTRDEAEKAVRMNHMNMWEHYYNYIVIEYIECGIHPTVEVESWWKWMEENGRWEQSIKKPEEFLGIVNFTLG